jgi:putative salt-induced outer membrane protein YdiY
MRKNIKGLMINFSILTVISFISVTEIFADKIFLENGDILTGTVEKLVEGKLIFKTDYSGPIEIQMEKIRKIFTDNPIDIHLKSGEILKGKVRTEEEGRIVIEKIMERETTTTDLKSVASINPPPPPPIKWTGSVTAGGNIQRGNTKRDSGFITAEANRRTEKDRVKFRYLFNYGEEDGEVTTRNHYGEGKYDYFFTKKFFGYIGLELYNDRFKDTKLRTFVGPGIGYQVWEDPKKSLLFEAGLSYFNLDRYHGEDDSGMAARLGWDFRYNILKWLIFNDRLQFYPTIGEGGDYFFRNEAALNVPLSSRWSLKLSNIIDYNSDPSPSFKRTDVQWLLGLQFLF